MRLIPGKTKVQIELFKGVTLVDIAIGLISGAMLVLILTSNLPAKAYFSLGVILVATGLLVRIDEEPNYVFLLRIFRHYGYKRRFTRRVVDSILVEKPLTEETGSTSFDAAVSSDTEIAAGAAPAEPAASDELDAMIDSLFDENKASENKEKKSKKQAKKEKSQKKKAKKKSASEKTEKNAVKNTETKKETKKKAGKSYDMSGIIGFTDIKDDFIVYAGEYYGAVIEIPPVEFRFFSSYRRVNTIENGIGRILRSLPAEFSADIVKIERPIIYDSYLDSEHRKFKELRDSYEKGILTEAEFQARTEILFARFEELSGLNTEEKVVEPFYYIVLFDSDRIQLNNFVSQALSNLQTGEINGRRLNTREIAVFLKYTNTLDFDERDAEYVSPENLARWAMPESVSFQPRTSTVNGITVHNLRVSGYPTEVDDAWLASVLTIPATKVVIKCKPMERTKAIRRIDHSLQELRGQYIATGVDSRRMELEEHIETLGSLLATLQGDNESLLDVNIYVTAYDIMATRTVDKDRESSLSSIKNMKRMMRRYYNEHGLRLNGMDFDQVQAFIGGQISAWDPLWKTGRGIPSNSLAAAYPWIFAVVSDEGGIKMGNASDVPVMINFFRRDNERINSNMVIVGKSGSGKSYATKSLLANLAADNAKIFILDPENEYTELAHSLHGKFINVGNARQGRLNPFHIITALDDEESGAGGSSGSYATHLQFLEEFFRQILPDCDKDSLEYLNSLIDRMYAARGITQDTDLSTLRPADYPTFDDLYDAVLTEFQSTDNEYIHTMLRTLINHVSKFADRGRNANIWNGPSTITTDENFTVFNFQSLLANRNGSIANAQMLLVLKYIDNEIIKNRDYNTRHKTNRKIVVVIDEAHVFIDNKYPVALDFMFQLAKRIRKYNGMQIVITQNIKDFVGSEELARKSTAIINACQYSFIFALSPNDMDDLCKLYEKSGGINEVEQEQIVTAPRGQTFTVMSAQSRTSFHIDVPKNISEMFRNPDFTTNLFDGEKGKKLWEGIVGESRSLHDEALAAMKKDREEEENSGLSAASTSAKLTFLEMDEDEYMEELLRKPEKSSASKVVFQETEREPNPVQKKTAAAPAVTESTEQLLLDRLSRFTYDALIEEIRRSVREELGIRKSEDSVKVEIPEQQEKTAAVDVLPEEDAFAVSDPVAPVKPLQKIKSDITDDFDQFDEDDGFTPAENSLYDEDDDELDEIPVAPQYSKAENPASPSNPEVDTFDVDDETVEAAKADLENDGADGDDYDYDDDDDYYEEEDFGAMQSLMQEAAKQTKITPFEVMKQYGDKTMEITFADLQSYNLIR